MWFSCSSYAVTILEFCYEEKNYYYLLQSTQAVISVTTLHNFMIQLHAIMFKRQFAFMFWFVPVNFACMTHQPTAHPSYSNCNRKVWLFLDIWMIIKMFLCGFVTAHLLPDSATTLCGHGDQFERSMAPIV